MMMIAVFECDAAVQPSPIEYSNMFVFAHTSDWSTSYHLTMSPDMTGGAK